MKITDFLVIAGMIYLSHETHPKMRGIIGCIFIIAASVIGLMEAFK